MSKLTASADISTFLASSSKTQARSNIGFSSSPITVDNEAARKNVISYNGGPQVGATRVIQSDTPNIVWYLISENVASDDSWIGQPYTNESSGRIAFDLQVSDVSDIVPDSNVIGRVGKNLTLGNDETVGGYRIDTAVRLNEIDFTLIVNADDSISMYNYDEIGAFAYIDATIKAAHLGTNVTNVDFYAFYGCSSLSSVILSDSITVIGDDAFAYCSSLTSITIPDSVTTISYEGFSNCSSLSSVTLGDGLTDIGSYAFNGCTALSSVTLPDSVTTIGDYAFYFCTSLTSITIPNSVTSIGSSAFTYCTSLASVTIPDSVTSIGSYAFTYCTSLASVTIPDSVTSIGGGAFQNCSSLSEANIYVTKTIIDAATDLFLNSGLTTVYARTSDATWTAGTELTIGGKSSVTVIKDL
jgi:hypothetical protein